MTTPWVLFSCFGVFFRLNNGELEYQQELADGSMEPFDDDEGPNIPDPFNISEPVAASDKIVIAYLANPDAPEHAHIKAFITNPEMFKKWKLQASLPIVCAECNTRFGDQCQHF